MRKLILFTVALLCAASMWAADPEMEGPWKYESMRSGTCGTDINQTISYNQLDNSRWGTITSWHNETDGIGFTVSGSSTKTSKNGVFSLYSLTRTIPSYSKCNYAWKYQIKSYNTRHHSRAALYACSNLDELKALYVDFTIDNEPTVGEDYRIRLLNNTSFESQPDYAPIETWQYDDKYYFEFNNLEGDEATVMSTYLMLTHVVQSEDKMNNLNEWGSLKHLEFTETWTYCKFVSFHANGGSGLMEGVYFETSTNLPANTFVREGYTFAGWAKTPNGAVEYAEGAEITATENDKGHVTLYAIWTPNQYAINYELNDGTAENPASYAENAALTLNPPTKADYSFLGWTGSNGVVPQTTVTIAKGSKGAKSFTAHWMSNAVATTQDLITAIGEVAYTSESKTKIDDARTAYNALSTDDQALVSNYITLMAAEEAYEAAKDAAGNTTINFMDQDESSIDVAKIQLDYPEAPEEPGFTFLYWRIAKKDLTDGTIRLQAVYTSTPTDLDDTIVNGQSSNRKFIKDGNLYILKDEFIYTINGQRVNK